MPELPEVETITRQLNLKLKGKKIVALDLRLKKIIRKSLSEFNKKTIGATVKRVYRRAKLAVIELENGYSVIIHLKLTGQLLLKTKKDLPGKFTHFIFQFQDGGKLFFRDTRQFGYLDVLSKKELENLFNTYGPEPLEKSFNIKDFIKILEKKPKSKIKVLLLDQKFLAGVGNIYANEALHLARIHPERRASSLEKEEIKNLLVELREVLELSLKVKGCSESDYVDAYGQKGSFEKYLKAYRRQGELCTLCQKNKIKRTVIAGRGTFYCAKCQVFQ